MLAFLRPIGLLQEQWSHSRKLSLKSLLVKCFTTMEQPSCSEIITETRKYDDAIRKLNSLQTNASVLQEARKRILSGTNDKRFNNVNTTLKYIKRLGLNIEELNNKIIHISGTKGKGTTALLTESLLRSVPYKTGLFTSPHLISVRERISVNGVPLSLSSFAEHFWEVYDTLYKLKEDENDMPSYFKFLTVMALKVFLNENVDVAIIEVGIGGELDCTNVFKNTPIVGITSIGLDHTPILGDTEELIAWQKGGIFKKGCKAFTVPNLKDTVMKVLQDRAAEKECQLEVVPLLTDYSWDTNGLSYPEKLNSSLSLQLAKSWEVWINNGKHLNYNKLSVSKKEQLAIAGCTIPGRYHIIDCKENNIRYYLDGAHTLESIKIAKDWFESQTSFDDCIRILIFNVTGNRQVRTLLEVLKGCKFMEAIFCSNHISNKPENNSLDSISTLVNVSEGLANAKENLKVWSSLNEVNGSAVSSVSEALSLTLKRSTERPVHVLVTGSMHLVGATLSIIKQQH